MSQDFSIVKTTLLHEIANYASVVIPHARSAHDLFQKAFDMFLEAYRIQAKARVENKEEDVAHMETCQCFVQEELLLVSLSIMFRKVIQNRDFLGFWDDNSIVDTMEKRQNYMHMTFVILCDITVRFWDDHVIDMNLYESYITLSKGYAEQDAEQDEQDRKNARRSFNKHYFKVFSWIDCSADISKYDLTEYMHTPTLMVLMLLWPDILVSAESKKRNFDQMEEETSFMQETCSMELS